MLVGLNKNVQNRLVGSAEGVFKSLFSLIPLFSVILGAWDGYQNARSAEFVQELSERIALIEQGKIDDTYIQSEEFYDLIQKSFQIRLQHRSKLKAKFIVNLIIESMHKERDPRFDTDMKETFLSLLDGMSDLEQIFLSEFAKGKYKDKSRNDVYQNSDDSRAIALDALYTKGILKDADTWEKAIEVSMLGREFIEYITILSRYP